MRSPWYKIPFIFALSPVGRLQKRLLKTLHSFSEDIIAERKQFHLKTNGKYLYKFDETDNKDILSEEYEEKNKSI
ncbi:hypothetical protein M0802_007525 [Mischocyttarus mexicanus]|nr:hypothetical protein M0802_007525 [Mischocyttarus mexicanus]